MRVFLDVGAHLGETVEAILDPKYQFDRIVCFEPAAGCREKLQAFGDARVEVMPFGLSNRTCSQQLFGAGTLAASVYPDMQTVAGQSTEVCRFIRARDWFSENVRVDDVVFLKLNCEGSECDIVEDLLEAGLLGAVAQVLIDFDVRKIPSQRHREAEVREKLARAGSRNVCFSEDVMIGSSHIARVQNWLHQVGADRCPPTAKLWQALYLLRAPARVRRAVLAGRFGRTIRAVRRVRPSG